MANFPRNTGGSNPNRSSAVFGGNPMPPGHVTPAYGQRVGPADRRSMMLGNSNQVNTAMPPGAGYTSVNNAFGSGDATNTPPLLDLSEFPSLTHRVGSSGSGTGGGGAPIGGVGALRGVVVMGANVSGSSVMEVLSTIPPPQISGNRPYVGMVKQPTNEFNEFTMSSADFPALPCTSHNNSSLNRQINVGSTLASSTISSGTGSTVLRSVPSSVNSGGGSTGSTTVTAASSCSSSRAGTSTSNGSELAAPASGLAPSVSQSDAGRRPSTLSISGDAQRDDSDTSNTTTNTGIQTFPDGRITNIPSSMVSDQFGIAGLLTFIRAAETDSHLVSLALGQDLTALGLSLNATENLYPTFGGPWAEFPCRPLDLEYTVPPEYYVNHNIRTKLAPIKIHQLKDDLLFFMFYNYVGDFFQMAAACELYTREWRYHMEERLWMTQVPGMPLAEKTPTHERGTYFFFDAQNWRKIPKEFYLDYSKLEGRPIINPEHFNFPML